MFAVDKFVAIPGFRHFPMPAAADGFSIPPLQTSERAEAGRFEPVQGPAVWHADELGQHPEQWTYTLSSRDIDELEIAVRDAEKTGKEIQDITLEDVSLPSLGPHLTAFRDEVVHGRGFQLIQGLPVHRWSRKQTVTAYWILDPHWGRRSPTTRRGTLRAISRIWTSIFPKGRDACLLQTPICPSTKIFVMLCRCCA